MANPKELSLQKPWGQLNTAEPSSISYGELRLSSDEVLMAQLQAANGDALAVLFDRYHRLVFQIALKIVRDIGEAEDVVQNVFLEIYKVAAQFNEARGSTRVWILQYAYHRSMNRRQQLIVRKFYASNDISELQDSRVSAGDGALPAPVTKRLIEESLQTINSVQKRVLKLAYFEGLSLKEIAEETGESLGNVRHHYYRGLSQLRAFLTGTSKNRVLSRSQQAEGVPNGNEQE